jgi:cell division protein FtsZ
MGDIVAPKAGVHQAFAAADVTLSQSVRSIVGLIQRPGLIKIGFDDLAVALRSANSRCLFGYGESDSDNRAHDALTQALKNPLMDRGRLLDDAANVLVQVAGGPGMTLSEVEVLMNELNRHIGHETQILFGTAVDGRMGNRLAVTLISSLSADGSVAAKPARKEKARTTPPPPPPAVELPKYEPEPAAALQKPLPIVDEPPAPLLKTIDAVLPQHDLLIEPEPEAGIAPEPITKATPQEPEIFEVEPEPVLEREPEPPRVILPKKKPALIKEPKPAPEKIAQAKQEILQFESVTRGRFEKSEPTIVEGQDLDVPTFLRKNVRVK